MKVEVTDEQLISIYNLKEDAKAMLGSADDDSFWIEHIKNIEEMFDSNGLVFK